jgi:hypothetical protein
MMHDFIRDRLGLNMRFAVSVGVSVRWRDALASWRSTFRGSGRLRAARAWDRKFRLIWFVFPGHR